VAAVVSFKSGTIKQTSVTNPERNAEVKLAGVLLGVQNVQQREFEDSQWNAFKVSPDSLVNVDVELPAGPAG